MSRSRKPFNLDRRENADHQLVIVLDRQQLPAGHIAQLGMGGEENGRREFRREAIRKIEIHIETPQVARFLLVDLVDLVVRENLSAGGLLDMRQRHEAGGRKPLLRGFRRGSWPRGCPRSRRGQFDPDAALHGLAAARHHDPGDRLIDRS